MEIALQEKSKGIVYEGYTKAFRQCIFEEGDVVGKNERYEFRLIVTVFQLFKIVRSPREGVKASSFKERLHLLQHYGFRWLYAVLSI
ncbi:unnamed protein product, partial [Heligmosomoides polygyrus]|uniref:DUF3850 domain-containing protein n=1 Tax=Heligmosomoides polygyrus TaxID=6339 RepID=A0A183GX84_HELPZ